jgi:hypothetical protein
MPYGLTIKEDIGDTRVEIRCAHQSGLIYVVPSEASWVCQPQYLHAHALAGFFGALLDLADPRITELMQRWGLYYRSRPLDTAEEQA